MESSPVLVPDDSLRRSVDSLASSIDDLRDDLEALSDDVMEALTTAEPDPDAPPPVTNEMILEALTPSEPDPDAPPPVTNEMILEALTPAEGAVSNEDILSSIQLLSDDVRAISQSLYQGTISSTYVDIFERCMDKVGVFDDYLLYRSAVNTYVFCYGDLSLNGTTFVGSNLDSITISTQTNVNGYVLSFGSGDSLRLNVGTQLVYSSLGQYPTLHHSASFFLFPFIFIMAASLICAFIRPWFAFTYRNSCNSDRREAVRDVATV